MNKALLITCVVLMGLVIYVLASSSRETWVKRRVDWVTGEVTYQLPGGSELVTALPPWAEELMREPVVVVEYCAGTTYYQSAPRHIELEEYQRGVGQAKSDVQEGSPRCYVIGEPTEAHAPYREHLIDVYGLAVQLVGCEAQSYLVGYNSIAMRHIKALHGEDAFSRLWTEAQRGLAQ